MVALVIAVVVIVGVAALLVLAGRGLTPTRPRPGSRHRGKTLIDVDAKLQAAARNATSWLSPLR